MGRAGKRAERLIEMERLYCQGAYSDSEMAERLGVDRTTVYRDRQDLELRNPFREVEEGRHRIDLVHYISDIKVNRAEALSLYLAARRTSQQTRFAQAATAGALEKLASSLQQPMTERLVQAADRILRQQADPRRADLYETIARAWIERLSLRLHYHAFSRERQSIHRFDVYLLEPSPWSDGVYLIGYSDLARRVITLKLDRVEKAVLGSAFTVRAEFNEEAMLKHAWGIWGSDRTPETVRLRFAPGAATRRLKESIWHPLEQVSAEEDGGCIWEAPIAEWQEMLPWIRGWGADVEALAPVELRVAVEREVRRLMQVYRFTKPEPSDNDDYDDARARELFR